ncbi:hypothetical protein L6452_10284 [Arctium lappa]|uniref:Uncharacterized protein n=1 Tax=Arctium lappa TaxID=4217 RepID=A0ACB9DMM9_ARCLA|nr:hypothetical protein L6452_10284 [Arctium lappa]
MSDITSKSKRWDFVKKEKKKEFPLNYLHLLLLLLLSIPFSLSSSSPQLKPLYTHTYREYNNTAEYISIYIYIHVNVCTKFDFSDGSPDLKNPPRFFPSDLHQNSILQFRTSTPRKKEPQLSP